MNTITISTITKTRRSHGSGLVASATNSRCVLSTAGSTPHRYHHRYRHQHHADNTTTHDQPP
jgi:hypothetical protein